MEKNIKDYLHLYLWCEVIREDAPNEPIILNGEILHYILTTNGIWKGKYKPILRPLSDMTKEEDKECHNIMISDYSDKFKGKGIIHYEADKIKYLLSKHFDLFGLIDAGLAIDATTLK